MILVSLISSWSTLSNGIVVYSMVSRPISGIRLRGLGINMC